MSALVAYEDSDSESEESQLNEIVEKVIIPEQTKTLESKGIFTNLPEPQTNGIEEVEEQNDEFLNKKEIPSEKPKKQPVKISIPSLSQFINDDDEEPVHKKVKVLKASGLFSLLPPPKSQPITTKHFVPNSVKQHLKSQPPKVKKQTPLKSCKPSTEELESDDEEYLKNIPDTFDEATWQKVCGKPKKTIPKPIIEDVDTSAQTIEIAPEPIKPYGGLDNQAFKELMGGNCKRKLENVDILDIHEDEMLSDKDAWMTKSLTDPELAPKYVVKDPVNDTCKRKHHITYLAQQAKANEQELQNQWASNRFTRQKTQAKYGF